MNPAESTETMQSDVTTSTIPADDLKPITPFKVIFETVQDGKSCVNLFDKVEIKKQDSAGATPKDSKTTRRSSLASGLLSMLTGGSNR